MNNNKWDVAQESAVFVTHHPTKEGEGTAWAVRVELAPGSAPGPAMSSGTRCVPSHLLTEVLRLLLKAGVEGAELHQLKFIVGNHQEQVCRQIPGRVTKGETPMRTKRHTQHEALWEEGDSGFLPRSPSCTQH